MASNMFLASFQVGPVGDVLVALQFERWNPLLINHQ